MEKAAHHLNKLAAHYLGGDITPNTGSLIGIAHAVDHVLFKKGDRAFKEDQRSDYVYFIDKGAARSYYLKDGLEVTTWFAFENDLVASLQGYLGNPADETVEFIEDSACLRINLLKLKEKQKSDLLVSNFICGVLGEHALFLENRLRQLQHNTGIDRYFYLLENEPELVQRVPLSYLASYLGMRRETLSRLRARITL